VVCLRSRAVNWEAIILIHSWILLTRRLHYCMGTSHFDNKFEGAAAGNSLRRSPSTSLWSTIHKTLQSATSSIHLSIFNICSLKYFPFYSCVTVSADMLLVKRISSSIPTGGPGARYFSICSFRFVAQLKTQRIMCGLFT